MLRGCCRGVAQNEGVVGTTPADVMQLMMVSQYTDMLKDVGGTAHSTVFVPNGASAVGSAQAPSPLPSPLVCVPSRLALVCLRLPIRVRLAARVSSPC